MTHYIVEATGYTHRFETSNFGRAKRRARELAMEGFRDAHVRTVMA